MEPPQACSAGDRTSSSIGQVFVCFLLFKSRFNFIKLEGLMHRLRLWLIQLSVARAGTLPGMIPPGSTLRTHVGLPWRVLRCREVSMRVGVQTGARSLPEHPTANNNDSMEGTTVRRCAPPVHPNNHCPVKRVILRRACVSTKRRTSRSRIMFRKWISRCTLPLIWFIILLFPFHDYSNLRPHSLTSINLALRHAGTQGRSWQLCNS